MGGDEITSGTSKFALNNNPDATPQMTLCYTMENTTSREAQKNGYSTGILFQAQYFPAQWTVVKDDDTTDPEDIDYDSNTDGTQSYDDVVEKEGTPESHTFYVKPAAKYHAITKEAIAYESYEAILAGFLNDMLIVYKSEVTDDTNLTISKFIFTKVRIKSDKQKNVAKLLADRRFRKMA